MYRITQYYAFKPPAPTYGPDDCQTLWKNRRFIPYIIHTVLPLIDPKCFTDYPTLIYSHGNASDIGMMRDWVAILSNRLNVNVICYDYTGYGNNGTHGKCSEQDCYCDIEAVYDWLTEDLKVPPASIILWGSSIGSGPTVHLASVLCKKAKTRPLCAVILQSPLTSAVRVISKKLEWIPWADIFRNIDKIQHVNVPVFLFHGDSDNVINVSHSQELYDKLPCKDCCSVWIIPGANHNDIESSMGHMLLERVSTFLDDSEKWVYTVKEEESSCTSCI